MNQLWSRRLGLILVTAGACLLIWAGADKGMAAYRQATLRREAARLFAPDPGALHTLGQHLAGAPTGEPAAPGSTPTAAGAAPTSAGAAQGVPPAAARVPVPEGLPLAPESGPLVGREGLKAETPLFRLIIPAIAVENVVVEGSTARALSIGPGHLEGTALPGEPGNVVIAGHRDYFFWAVGDLKPGDPIYVQARRGYNVYRVAEKRVVKDTDLWVTEPTPEQTLTLITCYPLIHAGYTDQRLVIFARRAPA